MLDVGKVFSKRPTQDLDKGCTNWPGLTSEWL